MHALAAARLGNVALAKRLFDESAAIDLDDTMGNAAHGVHIAALGGLWQATVLGFAGLGLERRGIRLEPQLPPDWQALRFSVQWHGRLVRVEIAGKPMRLRIMLERGRPMEISVGPLRGRLERAKELSLVQAADGRWEEAAAAGE
jgi:kojibiose phosphorylase